MRGGVLSLSCCCCSTTATTTSRSSFLFPPKPIPTVCSLSVVSTADVEVSGEASSVAGRSLLRRRLILLRHAESTAPARFFRDHDRPLSKSGRADAISVSVKLEEMGWVPQLILSRMESAIEHKKETFTEGFYSFYDQMSKLSDVKTDIDAAIMAYLESDAARTKETLQIMQEHANGFSEAKVFFIPSFYSVAAMDGQTADHLQRTICEYSTDEILTVMCMGHNRGWEEAASMFSGTPIELKTCNAALLEAIGNSWTEAFIVAGAGGWRLHGILKPNSSL